MHANYNNRKNTKERRNKKSSNQVNNKFESKKYLYTVILIIYLLCNSYTNVIFTYNKPTTKKFGVTLAVKA